MMKTIKKSVIACLFAGSLFATQFAQAFIPPLIPYSANICKDGDGNYHAGCETPDFDGPCAFPVSCGPGIQQ